MQIQKIFNDGMSKAKAVFSLENKKVNGVKIQFTKPTITFQNKVAKQIDEFIKTSNIHHDIKI